MFKVYIKQSRIWETLSTSKMELFVTLVICKVIFCRLMILYMQYCPMSVFICVSLLLVPYCSRWFHLQTSELVLLITMATVVFYWAMTLHVQFLPINFLVFLCQFITNPSCYRWFQIVPTHSRWLHSSFQVVPACSRCFQIIPAHSLFQYVHNIRAKIW